MDTWVRNAVEIASILVGEGDDRPATLAVACLPANAIQSDAEPLIRAMLTEQGVPSLPENAEDAHLRGLLAAFARRVVEVHEFIGEFYSQLPAWDRQDGLQRETVVALDRWEAEGDPEARQRIEDDMRRAILKYMTETPPAV